MSSDTSAPRLKRELTLADAAAFSIGLIGPVGAIAVNGVGAAGILGTGATWAFLFALVGVLLVAYGFIRLSQDITHSGSVYGLVGVTLGPRTGFVAGAALAFAYLTIGTGSTIAIGLFTQQAATGMGIDVHPDWSVIALAAVLVVGVLSATNIRVITRTLLVVEAIGILLVVGLTITILVRIGGGTAPRGQSLSWDFLSLPPGVDVGAIGGAAVFGFLAFAGFEGAAALGEESVNPRRDVPRAIIVAIAVVAVFYISSVVAQSLGYGVDAAGLAAFQGAESAFGELAGSYVGRPLAVMLNLAAAVSSIAITIGTVNACARVLYATARGAGDSRFLSRLSSRGEPATALAVTLVLAAVIIIGQRLAGTSILDAVFYWLTLGTLSLLVAYALVTLGALRYLFLRQEIRAPRWQMAIPILGLVFIGYVLYRNTVGVATPYDRFPFLVGGYLLVATAVAALTPGLADRVRTTLAREVTTTTEPVPSQEQP